MMAATGECGVAVSAGVYCRIHVGSGIDLFRLGDKLTELLLAAEESAPVLDSSVSVDRGEGVIKIEMTIAAPLRMRSRWSFWLRVA